MRFKKILMSVVFLALTVSGTLKAQVTADFSADDLVVCPGVPVVFTNLSTYPGGSSPTYLWSFPSGFASSLTEANPTVYYYTPGTYTVTLTTTVAGTGSDIETKTAYITVVTPPDASFTYSIPDVCNQMVVDFDNNSVAGTAAISSYLWDFGDATFSTATNPIKTFTTENTFSVILFITDANGCSDNATVSVTTLAPVASSISSTGSLFSCGTLLSPTISATTTEGTAPYSYSWDYGNGTTSTLASSIVNYSDCGTYDIIYTVTDALGCSLTKTYNDYVNVSCPEADFSMSDDTICSNESITFTNLSDPGATSYYWQFNYPTALSTSTLENPVSTFTAAGTRLVNLTVTYPGGCTASHLDTVVVLPKPGLLSIAATDTFGCETPFTTTLWPVGVTGTGPFTYLWTVGAFTSTDSVATFTLTEAINYTVTLTVTDANGCSITLVNTGFIKIKKPVHNISATPLEGCAPLLVTFTNSSSSAYVPLDYFVWDYDDGNIDTLYTTGSHDYVFTDPGNYHVEMTLYTIDGCPKSGAINITVGEEVAEFVITNDPIPACNPIELDNLSFGSDFTTINWGDGSVISFSPGATDTIHFYSSTDTMIYVIVLTAVSDGCTSTWVDSISVLTIVSAVYATWNCDNPLEFHYEVDTSIVTGDFCWDFGSGDTLCNVVNVTYTYPSPGSYSGEITTDDPIEVDDCEVSTAFSAIVPDNNFSFTSTPVDGCGDLNYNIESNLSSDFPSELTYTWTIGPSSISGFSDVVSDVSEFIYAFPGFDAYPILMSISDSNGCFYTAFDTVIISGAEALFIVDSINGCSPFTVYLSDASSLFDDAGGDISIVSYEWVYDGGTCPTYYGIDPPPCTFASGSHDVTLTITDNGGCAFSYTETISVTGEVSADFIADSLACNSSEPLYFTNTSIGDITDVLWDFGDGSTSTDFSALHPYAIEGTYTITLTVSDVYGCNDTHSETISVELDSIYADFDVTYLTASSCPPIPLQLSNTSYGVYTDFWWEVERETGVFTYILDTVILTYTIPGDYDVSIYVTGATGCIDTLTVPDALDIPGPTGEMEYSPIVDCTPAEITFAFSDLTADLSYVDFGDGDTVLITGDMTYDYTIEGVYCPTLILIDASGCSFQLLCDSSITIYQTHEIDISVSDTGLCLGETLTIYNASIGSVLNPIEGYLVDFGDGTPLVPYTDFDSITYTYTIAGDYILNVITMSDVACGDTIEYEIEVYPMPSGTADITPYSGCAPLDVNFTITDITADIAILDYGDGNMDTIAGDVSYAYTNFGIFEPTLTLINGGACAIEILFDESVEVFFPPTAGLIVPDTIACSGEQLIFINNSTDTTFNPIVNYTLDFGDGTTAFTSDEMDTVYHSYTSDGAYISTFIVENNVGCTDTLIFNTYADQLPEGALSISPLEGCVPLNVNFEVIGLVADEAIIDFGDGNSDTVTADIIYTYTTPGDYTPIFYLNNANGCNIVLTYATINVELIPVAGFTIEDSSVCLSESITLFNASSDTAVSPITGYIINYGDGTISMYSDFDSLDYTYSDTGVYDVTLIAQNSAGCRDTIIQSVTINEVPSAVLELTPFEGCIPLDVTFSFDTFSADEMILHYGDGMMDTIAGDITYTYTSAGAFTPILFLSNTTGCFDSIILDNINAGNTPVADFEISDTTICFGESVTLYNNSWDTIWSPISSLEVNFGDGIITTVSSIDSLIHDYAIAGSYTISLVVANDYGCSDTISKNVSVGEVPAATVALDPLEGCLPLDITFDFESVFADDIIIDFGDGYIDTVSGDVTYTYITAGDFIPQISLLNDNGCASDISVFDVIHVGITPIADFAITDPAICFGEDIEIVNNSWDTTISPIITYTVDFGDGSVSTYSSLTSLTHNYSATGDFVITLSVENDLGCASEIFKNVSVGEVPSATVALDPLEGCLPLDITFDFESVFADDIIIDFGDGYLDTVSGDVTYTYITAGDFIPQISLLNDNGCASDISVTDVIHVGITPIADFAITDSAICFGEDIEIVNNSWDTTLSPITTYSVDFGDGSVSTYSSLTSLTHNYSTTGDFVIALSVENDLGCASEIFKNVIVNEIPSASIDYIPDAGCYTLDVFFDITDLISDSAYLDFGDGTGTYITTGIDHAYTSSGIFIPELILTNTTGCSSIITDTDPIHVAAPPVAIMYFSDSSICAGESITIFNISTDTVDAPISSFTLDYGDGTSVYTGTSFDFIDHTYTTDGVYLVELTVTNSLGCESTQNIPLTIAAIPSAMFDVEPVVGCGTLMSTFNISSSTADSVFLNTGTEIFYVYTSSVVYNYTTPGVYIPELVLLNTTGCSSNLLAEDSIFVSYAPEALMVLSDSMPFCSGEEIFIINLSIDTIVNPLINPIDNYAIEVNGSLIFESTTMDSIAYTLATSGDYWITLITSNSLGCLDSTSTTITVHQTPDAIAGTNLNVCPGNELILDGTASTGGTTFEWLPAGNFVNNSVAQPIGIFPETTIVYLEYSNAFCADIDTIVVNIITDLELLAWPDTAICVGETIQIHSQYDAGDNPVTIVWLNGDFLSSTIIANPVCTPLNTITYTIAATCGDLIDYEDVTIVVNTLPSVVATDTINAYYGESFNLSSVATGNGPFIYSWTPTEYLGCSDCQNTIATPTSDATYFITVIDENNCTAADSVYLRLGYDCGEYLGLPNILTPNNDGFNDEFKFQSDAILDLSYFRIYDRWGRLMYETIDVFGSWDGTYNGVLCDPGVYVYSLQGSCFDGEVFINSGNITLIK